MKGKRVFWTLMGCLLIVACLHHNHDSKESFAVQQADPDEEQADSFLYEADTLLLDEAYKDAPLPDSVNQVFDDFLFLFDNSNRVQRRRIQFPLPVEELNGKHYEIQQSEWSYRSMTLGQDFCTVLWNSRPQMALANDTALLKARVEHIYLHSRIVEAFEFKRDSKTSPWMLAAKRAVSFDDYPLHEFLDFYRTFATDSTCQRRHVQNPLLFTISSEDSEEDVVRGTIDVDQWFEFAPEIPQAVLVNINYGQLYTNPNRVVLQMRGFRDSMQNLFVFQRDALGRWRLTEFDN